LLRRRKKTAAVLLLLLAAGAAVVGAAQFADANGAPSPIRVTAGKMTLDPESKVVIETSETDEAVVLILGKDAPKIETVKSTVK
jgi:hypothetical protein